MRSLARLTLAALGTTFALQTASPLPAGEIQGALLEVTAATPFAPLQNWSSAPSRFVLLEDGQVYLGGSKDVLSARLEKDEVKAFEAQVEAVRKMPGLASVVSFSEGDEPSFHLHASKGKPLDVRATGDPAKASPALRPLAALLEKVLRFDHPSLRPYSPASLSLTAREGGAHRGGCRIWTLPTTPREATAATTVPASAVETWGAGVYPTWVCVGDKSYEVYLRPLLPGERP